VYTGHLNPGQTQDVVINIDPNVTVANFAMFDTSHSLSISVTGASGNQLDLDPVENGIIHIDDPSTMIYLGYGFKQPRPGRWIVTLQTSPETPPAGADYAIAAQFHGGALLETTQDTTVPRLNETIMISGTLTADGAPVPLTSASAIVHQPDGSTETADMSVNANQAQLQFVPRMSGLYGIEVSVLANGSEGNVIDRAAFLTLDVQPTGWQTAQNQIIAIGLILLVIVVIVGLIFARRRRRRARR